MLPETLPEIPGLTVGARYIAGVDDIEIGGDWYDVMPLDGGNVMFVVGDVSGRGLAAGTIMAALRYAIRAYAAQGDDPAAILTKLANLISISDDGHFATVLCGVIDVDGHSVTLANAAHPEPLLINGQTSFVSTDIGVPIGVQAHQPYASTTIAVPAAATLVVFTDGLVERRGEIIDVGLQRLRETAGRSHCLARRPPRGPDREPAARRPRRRHRDPWSAMDELDPSAEATGTAEVTTGRDGVPVIRLAGEIDMSNVDALRVVIDPVIESGPERVDFDLAALEFMDSSGIALLLRVAAKARTVHVREPSAVVRRLIEATGLSDILPIDP